MNHFSESEWEAYVRNGLSEAKREKMERHLYVCERCLETFVKTVEAYGDQPVGVPDGKRLTLGVMRKIPERKSRFWDNALVQYAVAASLTVLLFGSGAFHGLMDGSDRLTQWVKGYAGWTEVLMDKAVSAIDAISPARKHF